MGVHEERESNPVEGKQEIAKAKSPAREEG